MMTISTIILVLTATLAALVAGLFYGWSVSVILGLKRLTDKEYVSFMQSTNRAIINPLFFISFFGTAILLPICTFLHYAQNVRFWYLIAGTTTYLVGVLGVTIFGNVPLNNKLEAFEMNSATDNEINKARKKYESPWAILNHIRAIFSIVTIVLLIIACLT